jgi:hypothetical protein
MLKKKVTTRQIEGNEYNCDGNITGSYCERPAIDDALSMLAFLKYGVVKFSGTIETSWLKGGMREPQTPNYPSEARNKIIVQPMKKLLPDKYSGKALWQMNSGELSGGGPRLIPYN